MAALPADVRQFSHLFCGRCQLASPCREGGKEERGGVEADGDLSLCPQCGGAAALMHRWGFCLGLEDSTGLVVAAVWGHEASALLPSLSPDSLHLSALTRQALLTALARIQSEGQWLDLWVATFAALPPSAATSSLSQAYHPSPQSSCTQESAPLLSEGDDDGGEDWTGRETGAAHRATLRPIRCRLILTALRAQH